MSHSSPAPARLDATAWLICVIASIGFAFDIYELLMGPLVFPPAVLELAGHKPGSPESVEWIRWLFFVPAFAGGVFGLMGGYLTDRLGRRRVLTWSILLYAFAAFAAGFSTNIWMLLFFRCLVFIGVCVEFVAAVAWLAELFPNPHQREKVLGYTQFFSSIGGLLVAVANGLAVKYAAELPAIGLPDWLPFFEADVKDHHAAWRYTLMSGLIPAVPLILIRPFLPESPAWKSKRETGQLRRPSIAELFAPHLKRTTIISTLMVACSFGAAFGAIQMMPQITPRLPEVKAEAEANPAKAGLAAQKAAANYTKIQEIGGLIGRAALALLVVRIISRRKLFWVFNIPGIFAMPLIFYAFATVQTNDVLFTLPLGWMFLDDIGVTAMHLAIAAAGFLTVAQFSFWGNYLPIVYPVHLRGTGESFAHNIGGRLIGTSMAMLTLTLSAQAWIPIDPGPAKVAYMAAIVGGVVFLIAFALSFLLPDPGIEIQREHQ
jgi:MFS family permease